MVRVEINNKLICNDKEYGIPAMPENLFTIIEDGGLVKSMKKRNQVLV
jgi:3-isopropylmalate/(R)-2-methylmalate dehydratase small subunit